jgi:hypothetical protein
MALIDGLTTNCLREVLQLLRRAGELLDSEEKWVRSCLARDAVGNAVLPSAEPRPVAFCISGAVIRAEYELHDTPVKLELPTWDEPAPIEGPKRLVSSLLLLGLSMLRLYMELYADEVKAARTELAEQAAPGEAAEEPRVRIDPTQLAAAVNDKERVTYSHITGVLAAVTAEVEQELRARRQLKGGAR